MMTVIRKHSGFFTFVLLAGIVIFCVWGLDYSALNTSSWHTFADTVKQLLNPDISYFYDGSGEDVLSLILVTIAIVFAGTTIGTILAIPFTLLASRNLWGKNSIVPRIGKLILDILRSFPEFIYAINFVKVVGPGAFAGVLAIGVHQIGMLGKLFAEEMEKMNEDAVEACKSVGAGGIGAPLIFAIQARNWDKVSIILLAVIVTVYLLDILTGYIRKRLK